MYCAQMRTEIRFFLHIHGFGYTHTHRDVGFFIFLFSSILLPNHKFNRDRAFTSHKHMKRDSEIHSVRNACWFNTVSIEKMHWMFLFENQIKYLKRQFGDGHWLWFRRFVRYGVVELSFHRYVVYGRSCYCLFVCLIQSFTNTYLAPPLVRFYFIWLNFRIQYNHKAFTLTRTFFCTYLQEYISTLKSML